MKFVNDILYVPPTLASKWCTFAVKPLGGSHFALASGSINALYNFSGLVRITRCRRMVLPAMVFLLGLGASSIRLPADGRVSSIFALETERILEFRRNLAVRRRKVKAARRILNPALIDHNKQVVSGMTRP